ncbi:MAG: tRNA1(Val) (adenine(37)-N6)-methyltransferase [Clostridia bacterium]
MNEKWAKPHERVDDLQLGGLRVLQNPSAFCFGMDAVLLADFVRLRPRDRVVDFGTGTGILPLLLSHKEPTATFDALEIQSDMADMAVRSGRMNGLEARVRVHEADLRNAAELLGRLSMSAAVCNPPYGKQGGCIESETKGVLIARHETNCDIEDIAQACAAVLRHHGRLAMVFPAQRMLELCDALRKARLEPKRMRMVCSKRDRPPYILLVEAVKNAKPALLWEPPLVVYHADGSETEEIHRIYHRA